MSQYPKLEGRFFFLKAVFFFEGHFFFLEGHFFFPRRPLFFFLTYYFPITGSVLLSILENGVSQYPKLEGRFPQVAGLEFAFDASAPPGARVIRNMVRVGDELLQENQTYRLCTKAYMRQGRDGYSMLKDCPVLVSLQQSQV